MHFVKSTEDKKIEISAMNIQAVWLQTIFFIIFLVYGRRILSKEKDLTRKVHNFLFDVRRFRHCLLSKTIA